MANIVYLGVPGIKNMYRVVEEEVGKKTVIFLIIMIIIY